MAGRRPIRRETRWMKRLALGRETAIRGCPGLEGLGTWRMENNLEGGKGGTRRPAW